MCRLLVVRSREAFDPGDHLSRFASVAKKSREYQGHGWGCAWKTPGQAWQIYRNIKPIWEDDLSRFPRASLLVAHVRSAFEDKDFNGELRGVKLHEQGRIGAEKIFNFIRRFDSGDTLAALKKGGEIIRNRTRHIRGMNIILVKDEAVYLSTFFNEDEEYFTMRCKEGPELVICSEAYPSEEGWKGIARNTVGVW
jgi:hypothetical protein